MDGAPEPSLRDMLAANLDTVEQGGDLNAPQPSAAPEGTAPAENAPGAQPPAGETPEQKSDRLANRLRAADGKLLPGTKPAEPAPAVPSTAPGAAPTVVATPAVAVARPAGVPDAWKKEHWGDFQKVAAENPKFAQYLTQREKEFQTGVSTYRQEADAARPLQDAIAPFLSNLQRFNLQPERAVHNLLAAHERLSLGSPQEKLALGAQIIRDYGIDPQALVQILTGQAQAPVVQQPQQPAQQPVNVQAEVRNILLQEKAATAHEQFLADVPTKYPHYETVKDDMAGLLQLGKAQDYESAYRMAIRLHDDIWEADQQAKSQAAEQQRLAANKATVTRAKANAVSVKSATPSAPSGTPKPTSLRGQLEEAFDDATASRV